MNIFFTTTNGGKSGRASRCFRDVADAIAKVDDQNIKAEAMDLKTRYEVNGAFDESEFDRKEIR